MYCFLPQTKFGEGNVFTGVCLSSRLGGAGVDWPNVHMLGYRTLCLLTSCGAGGDHWSPVQTCSLEDLPPSVLTASGGHGSGQYASYGNAILFNLYLYLEISAFIENLFLHFRSVVEFSHSKYCLPWRPMNLVKWRKGSWNGFLIRRYWKLSRQHFIHRSR